MNCHVTEFEIHFNELYTNARACSTCCCFIGFDGLLDLMDYGFVELLDLMDYWICWIMDLLNDDLNITCQVEIFFIV